MYSYILDDPVIVKERGQPDMEVIEEEEVQKAKGVSKSVIKHQISHQHYIKCLEVNEQLQITKANNIGIHTDKQQLYTTSTSKITLSPADSKVYLVNAIETLPYGHYKINE